MNFYFEFAGKNDSVIKIYDDNENRVKHAYHFLGSALRFFDKQAEYTWEGKNGFRDSYVSFYDAKTQTVPIGLIARLCEILKGEYPDAKFGLSPRIRAMFTPTVKITDDDIMEYAKTLDIHNRTTGKRFLPYEHQLRLMNYALNHRRGCLMACTSAGKSLAIFTMARYLNEIEHRKVLVIVPSKALVEQLYLNFRDDYGWDGTDDNCTLIYGESKDKVGAKQKKALATLGMGEDALLKPITISTWQSLQHKEPSFFKPFQAVIVDEAHGMRGEVLRNIVDSCENAENFKIGVSGTLPDDGLEAGYIESCLGKKYVIVRLKELINKGILTPVKVVSLVVPYPMDKRPFICNAKFDEEYSMIAGNRSRYDIMDLLISSGKINLNENTVILYKNKTPLKLLADYLKEKYPQFTYHIIEGDVKVKDRSNICSTLESTNGNILIGTYGCLQQGVNVKNLHTLVFGEPGKSIYMIMQSIGRIVRANAGKTQAVCYDIVDDASYDTKFGNHKENYMLKHFYLRSSYYAEDEIPIEQVDLSQYIQATVETDNVKAKRKARALAGKKKQIPNLKWKKQF